MHQTNEFEFLGSGGMPLELKAGCAVILVILALIFGIVALLKRKKKKENSIWLCVLMLVCIGFAYVVWK